MFFTGKNLHEILFDCPEKMPLFTGRFIHSHLKWPGLLSEMHTFSKSKLKTYFVGMTPSSFIN